MAAAWRCRETDFPMRFVPTIRRPVDSQAMLASTGQRRLATGLLTVIGPCRLVVGTPSPPSGALSLNPEPPAGVLIHEAAGCRSLRRFERISAGGGVLVCRRCHRRFLSTRSARAWWCAPAGGWGVVGYVTASQRHATRRRATLRAAAQLNATFLTDHQTTRNQTPLRSATHRHAPLRGASRRIAALRNASRRNATQRFFTTPPLNER